MDDHLVSSLYHWVSTAAVPSSNGDDYSDDENGTQIRSQSTAEFSNVSIAKSSSMGYELILRQRDDEACGEAPNLYIPQPQPRKLELPLELTMCRRNASEALQRILVQDDRLTEDEFLAMLLLHEKAKGDRSFYAPYIACLPETYETPLFWSEQELEELRGTNVYFLTQMMKRQIENDYYSIQLPVWERHSEVLGFCSPATMPSSTDYAWALSTIWSRAFGLNISAGTSSDPFQYTHVLCPVVDLMNHDVLISDPLDDFLHYCPRTNCLVFDIDKSIQDQLMRRKDIQIYPNGEPLYISYGQYTNAKLLYSYGFVDPRNPLRGIDFWVKCPPTDPFYEAKLSILDRYMLSTNNHTYDFTGTLFDTKPISEKLLAMYRVILMNECELLSMPAIDPTKMVTKRNELAVYTNIITTLKRKLQSYPTTLVEDEELLLKLSLPVDPGGDDRDNDAYDDMINPNALPCYRRRRHQNAIQVRMEDKIVIKESIAWAERSMQILLEMC